MGSFMSSMKFSNKVRTNSVQFLDGNQLYDKVTGEGDDEDEVPKKALQFPAINSDF